MASSKINASNAIDNLTKHLPTGTVLIFQIMSPLFSNDGDCHAFNRLMMGLLVGICGLICALSCFTDSFIDSDDVVHYCLVTPHGLKPFESGVELPCEIDINNSDFGISIADVVHAVMSALMFFSVTLLEQNTVNCLYSSLGAKHREMLTAIPVSIGALSSAVFTIYPTSRRGIGYGTTSSSKKRHGQIQTVHWACDCKLEIKNKVNHKIPYFVLRNNS